MFTIAGPRAATGTSLGVGDVPVIPWPSEAAQRNRLAAARRPRILAVIAGGAPPDVSDALEDWVRVPVDVDELTLRRQTLQRRWLDGRAVLWLDEYGLVHRDDRWVALSDAQAATAGPLIASIGRTVRREEVRRACAAEVGTSSDDAFSALLGRLTTKLAALDAVLHRLSGGRLLLEVPSSPARSV
jgi:hypothetical protein